MRFFADADDFVEEQPDVVIISTSILSMEAVLESFPVQRLRRSTLVVDVLSVKARARQRDSATALVRPERVGWQPGTQLRLTGSAD